MACDTDTQSWEGRDCEEDIEQWEERQQVVSGVYLYVIRIHISFRNTNKSQVSDSPQICQTFLPFHLYWIYALLPSKYKLQRNRKCVYFINPTSLHLRPAGISLGSSFASSPCKYVTFCLPAAATVWLDSPLMTTEPWKSFLSCSDVLCLLSSFTLPVSLAFQSHSHLPATKGKCLFPRLMANIWVTPRADLRHIVQVPHAKVFMNGSHNERRVYSAPTSSDACLDDRKAVR